MALLVAVIQVARRLLAPPEPEPATAPDWPPLDRSTDAGSATEPATGAGTGPDVGDSAAVADDEPAWVEPGADGCPTSHPVKAKDSSKIFHVPGGGSYDRTNADRCYLDAAAAEADGYRQSKV